MRCITIMGPSQSGKTELVRALAGLEGRPARTETAGPLSLTRFGYLGDEWCAIDLAGGPEYARMAALPLMASDMAVLVLNPDPDEAVLAAPWLRAIEASGTPSMIFINRMDAPKGRIRDVVGALQSYSSHPIVLRQIPLREGGKIVGAVDLISERAWRYREGAPSTLVALPGSETDREQEARTELLEHMSDFDDALLEELVEDHDPGVTALFEIARRETCDRQVVPAFLGSASHRNGVTRFMKALRHEVPQVDVLRDRLGARDAIAVGFHAEVRKHLGKCVFLRALAAGVGAGATLGGAGLGGLAEIGGKSGHDRLAPGEVGLSVKSDQLDAGRLFSTASVLPAPAWAAALPAAIARVVTPVNDRDEVRLSAALARLAEADPVLQVGQDPDTGHALLGVQGPMHLRHTEASLRDDFGLDLRFIEPSPQYRETVSKPVDEQYRHRKQSGGAGQFADVAITLRPQPRGAGFAFDEVVKGGAVPRNYIPSVEEGARETLKQGPLGYPVIDIAVTLTDGKHHAVDSSDYAFRTAGRMALREALAKAGPVLLQPVMAVAIHVPSIFSGAMVSLVSTLGGQVLGFDRDPEFRGWDLFRALLPESALAQLGQSLGSATQGCAWVEARFDHYEELYGREAEKLVRRPVEAAQ